MHARRGHTEIKEGQKEKKIVQMKGRLNKVSYYLKINIDNSACLVHYLIWQVNKKEEEFVHALEIHMRDLLGQGGGISDERFSPKK